MIRSTVTVQAPVRVSFGGGGTDLASYYVPYGGMVLSAAISRYCTVTVRPDVDRFRIRSADYGLAHDLPAGELPDVAEPLSLPKAALEWAIGGGGDRLLDGVELSLASEVPPGTGLGSSSAMAVALVYALATYLDRDISATEVAEAACQIEIERLSMPIGKQDQYASAFGGINVITFSADGVIVEPLPLPLGVRTELEQRLLLFSTGRSRSSADILRGQQADTAAGGKVVEALHEIKALADEMRQALLAGELDVFGSLLDRGWQHKKRLSGAISSSRIDRCYEAALAAGALGGKITGAGGGGFLLLYCPPERQRELRAAMAGLRLKEMTFGLEGRGVHLSETSKEDGSSPIGGTAAVAGSRG